MHPRDGGTMLLDKTGLPVLVKLRAPRHWRETTHRGYIDVRMSVEYSTGLTGWAGPRLRLGLS